MRCSRCRKDTKEVGITPGFRITPLRTDGRTGNLRRTCCFATAEVGPRGRIEPPMLQCSSAVLSGPSLPAGFLPSRRGTKNVFCGVSIDQGHHRPYLSRSLNSSAWYASSLCSPSSGRRFARSCRCRDGLDGESFGSAIVFDPELIDAREYTSDDQMARADG